MAGDTSYQLLIDLSRPVRCAIGGRLGEFAFRRAATCTTGSAKRGLDARIARHLRARKAVAAGTSTHLLGAREFASVEVVRSRRVNARLIGGARPRARRRLRRVRLPAPGAGRT